MDAESIYLFIYTRIRKNNQVSDAVKEMKDQCNCEWIIIQNFASFCINPYNYTDFNADFCRVMRISAKLCGSKQCEILLFFDSADAAADFRKSP